MNRMSDASLILEFVGAGLSLHHTGLPEIEQVHPRIKLHPALTNAAPTPIHIKCFPPVLARSGHNCFS